MSFKNIINKIHHSSWENFFPQIPDESIDLIFTDPPYNISCATKIYRDYRKNKNGEQKKGDVSFDFGEWDYNDYNPIKFLEEARKKLNPEGSIIVFMAEQQIGLYQNWFHENMCAKQLLIFIKTNPLPQFRLCGYRQATEAMFWATKNPLKKNSPNFIFLKQQEMTNVFYAPIVGGKERRKYTNEQGEKKTLHPTQKPLSICQEIIKRHCRVDGVVLDPFSGVGSIPLAAFKLSRNFIGIEREEKFYLDSVKRLEENNCPFEQLDLFESLK